MAIATTSNPRVRNPEIESKALAEQVNLLFLHSRVIDLASIGVILFLVVLFRDLADPDHVIAWAVSFIAIEAARLVIDSYFHNAAVPVEHAKRWLWIFRIGNLMSAAGWGAAGIVLFPVAYSTHQLLLAAVLVGAVAVKVAVLATDYRSYVLFAAFVIGPIAINLLVQDALVTTIAAVVCLFVAVMLASVARRMFADMRDALCMRFAYADMADEFDMEMTTRINAENTLRRGERRGRRQSYILLDLAKEEAIATGDLPRALAVVTRKAAQAIHCTRVSVWFCDPGFASFRCVHLYDNGYHDTGPGIRLDAETNAKFFRRLERTRTFAVNDTGFDQRVRPFVSNYLAPYRVSAILGAPFRHDGGVRGVIVMEHVGLPRNWTRDERMFASSLSDFLSLALAASGRQQAQEQLRHLANYDRLTALPNRALFHDRLSHALVKAQRSESRIALLFVDVDRFKSVNDSLGHGTGDRVLRSIAKRLTRCVRKSDTVARLGGDEFTVIVEDADELETVTAICDRI
ncbi:MAG TPA: diguanylate cyclase, partial [Gammaproteobacteria bacterium]